MPTEKAIAGLLDFVMSSKVGPESLGQVKGIAEARKVIQQRNVVGIGVSRKVTDGKTLKDLAFTFFVEKKQAMSKLRATEAIPPVLSTETGQAVPTDVFEIGPLRPDANVERKPIEPGFSIGHFGGDTGTLGAIVKRDGKYYVLSNSHVLAKCGKAKKGDIIVYPGIADGGKKTKDEIARLAEFVKLKTRVTNTVDAAIAEIDEERAADLMAKIQGVGYPRGTIKAKAGMKVTKVGRTSGKTQATVLSATFRPLRLPYPDIGNISFENQILSTRFTEPGDSGSLVLDVKTKKVVGLHFASAKGGSTCAPIGRVLEILGVKLVTGKI
jgi:hypothetical protein